MFDLFGKRKMYKKGMEDALRANAAFAQKQQIAVAAMRAEIRSNHMSMEAAMQMLIRRLDGEIIGLQKYLDAREREALYKINAPMDIRELGNEEKQLLVAVLYQLASEEGTLLTEHQRKFICSVQKYLGISNPQTYADLSVVSDIDSLEYQKTILRVVVEFFYLQDGDEISTAQDEFLGYFSVNKKHANLIEEQVSQLYSIVGPEGIAEKYGFDPTQFEEGTATTAGPSRSLLEKEWAALEQSMDKALELIHVFSYLAYDRAEYESWGDEYFSKQDAKEAAERELRKIYDAQVAVFSACSSDSLAVRAIDDISTNVDSALEIIRKQVREFGRNTGFIMEAQKMENILSMTSFMEKIQKLLKQELQQNSYKYAIEDFYCYANKIELDSDDLELESGFMRFLEKLAAKWSYNLSFATIDLNDDVFKKQEYFSKCATEIIKRELHSDVFSKIHAIYAEIV